VQQEELQKDGQAITDLFRGMSAQNKELLAGVVLRSPDVVFDREALIDLGGGVTARLLWLGGAHTKGDELTLVEPDHTLISGDVVQNKTMPNIFGNDGTPTEWLATLDKVARLNVTHVLPDHSAPGDGSLVAAERALIVAIRTQALALKRQGLSSDAAAEKINATLKRQHPDWPDTNASTFVKSVYLDPAAAQ
jgi:glyoxylase-like metal-dependent hydrolase (beta-lactamase superfamily II)